MKVGILVLSQDNVYVYTDGTLPARPDFDKKLLLELCRDQDYVCGTNTRNTLPPSITDNAEEVDGSGEYDINLGIATLISNPPHLLIVVRSWETLHKGKSFSLDNYMLMYKSDEIELWIYQK